MISLFGRKEFDPPGSAYRDPRTALKVSGIWAFLSLAWISLSMDRVSHLRSTGRSVGVWREAAIWFWVVMLLFWMWKWWTNFRKYRADGH